MNQELNKSMVLDGIAASEAVDSSGEVLDIKGLDITDLEEGRGVLNYEHRGDSANGASANDVIGAITYAKKIYDVEDCANDRERKYWNKVQLPFVYFQAELFNSEGHPGAIAAAALVRYYHRRKLPLLLRYSIEGTTLERSGNRLKRAIAKRVAATIKPCNRSCISGVLSDSEESEASTPDLKDLLTVSKSQLGSYETEVDPVVSDPMAKADEDDEDLTKALAAGGFDAAPGSLTQGSALQVESIGRANTLKNQTLAAVRDWRGRGDLRTFLKNRLPEASEEFVDHFARLVEDYQLKKMTQLEEDLIKAVSTKTSKQTNIVAPEAAPNQSLAQPKPARVAPAANHQAKVAAMDDEDKGVDENAPMTIRGRALRPLSTVTSSHFDERKGVLYTPRGAFPMYLPQKDKTPGALEAFHNILNDPKRTAFHDYATANWMKVHSLLRKGNLPPQIAMHSVLFSQLSPNKAVPIQELMYSHLVDSMNDRGIDARDPRFAQGRQDWLDRNQPQTYPKTGRDYFTGYMNPGVTLKSPSRASGRQAGDLSNFMLADNAYDNMEQYHKLHPHIMDLVNHHKHNARAAVAELMGHKRQAINWSNMRRAAVKAGRPDPGPYQGADVPGLAPKTGRYMYAMLGGGNVHVPDTHFTRYLFGLEKGLDTNSINYLKSILWNPNNSHILDGIDRYYAKHHPAVEHMMQHPVFGKQFQDREDAIFPAFWKNWVAIVPHERFRQMKTGGSNLDTDHRPYWEAISPFLKSEGQKDLPLKTARLHAQWEQQYGEIPAQMMFYAYLVPMLLRAQSTETPVQKMQRIATTLSKAAQDMILPPLQNTLPQGVKKFKGEHVKPGEIEMISGPYKGSKFHYLGPSGKKFYVLPRDDSSSEPMGLSKEHEGTAFRINQHPEFLNAPIFVDANIHGHPSNKSPQQQSLIHGIDISREGGDEGLDTAQMTFGSNEDDANTIGWYPNHAGIHGLIKPHSTPLSWEEPDWDENDIGRSGQAETPGSPLGIGGRFLAEHHHKFTTPQREVLYHNMARDFFGMGQHVPVTAMFVHPETGGHFSVQEKLNNHYHVNGRGEDARDALNAAHTNGTLDKLGLMDLQMGMTDRHRHNYMIGQDHTLKLIDNAKALTYDERPEAHIWDEHHESNPNSLLPKDHWHNGSPTFSDSNLHEVHPEAIKWMQSWDNNSFLSHLLDHGVPMPIARAGVMRMIAMQSRVMEHQLARKPITRADLVDAANQASWAASGKSKPASVAPKQPVEDEDDRIDRLEQEKWERDHYRSVVANQVWRKSR